MIPAKLSQGGVWDGLEEEGGGVEEGWVNTYTRRATWLRRDIPLLIYEVDFKPIFHHSFFVLSYY